MGWRRRSCKAIGKRPFSSGWYRSLKFESFLLPGKSAAPGEEVPHGPVGASGSHLRIMTWMSEAREFQLWTLELGLGHGLTGVRQSWVTGREACGLKQPLLEPPYMVLSTSLPSAQ